MMERRSTLTKQVPSVIFEPDRVIMSLDAYMELNNENHNLRAENNKLKSIIDSVETMFKNFKGGR